MTTDFDSVDYFTDPSLVPDPHPYFDHLRGEGPGLLPDQQRRAGRHRVGGGQRRLQGHRELLVVRGGRGPVHPDPVHARGRRHLRAARGASRRDPDVRAHGHDGSAAPHRRALAAVPAAHPEAAEGERGLHVAAGRPPHRRVHRRWPVRVPDRLRQAVLAAGGRRLARRARRRTTRSSARRSARSGGHNIGGLDHEPIAANPLEWADEKFGHYIEDRRENPRDDVLTALATAQVPRRLDARSGRRRPHRHIPVRAPARRPPPSCSARRCGCSATDPTFSSSCATTAASFRSSSRNASAWTAR